MKAGFFSKCIIAALMVLCTGQLLEAQSSILLRFTGRNIGIGKAQKLDSVQVTRLSGGFDTMVISELRLSVLIGVDRPKNSVPGGLMLSNNFENPFSDRTSFDVTTVEPGSIAVEIFDIIGHKVAGYASPAEAGIHRFQLIGGALEPGLYFLRVSSGKSQSASKLLKVGAAGSGASQLKYEGSPSAAIGGAKSLQKVSLASDFRFIGFAAGFRPDTVIAKVHRDTTFDFRLAPLALNNSFAITSPVRGDVLRMSTSCTIGHINTSGESVAYDLSTDGGNTWQEIVARGWGSTWFVESGPYTDCRLRMHNIDSKLSCVSDSFSITAAYLEEYIPLHPGKTFTYIYHTSTNTTDLDTLTRSIEILDSVQLSTGTRFHCRITDFHKDTVSFTDSLFRSNIGLQRITASFEPWSLVPLYCMMDRDISNRTFNTSGSLYSYPAWWDWETRRGVGLWYWRQTLKYALINYGYFDWTYIQ